MGESEVRLSDAERDGVVDLLRRHCGEGRITLDEFAERTEIVYAARTRAQLEVVLEDLPRPVAPARQTGPATAPATTGKKPKRRWVLAVMGAAKRRGRWRVDQPVGAFAFWGGAVIDLRGAQIDVPVVDINAWAIMGSVEVIVPDGIPVDFDGFVLMGGREDRVRDTPPLPGAPLVRVRGYGMWGSVIVKSRKAGERDWGEELAENIQNRVQRELNRAQQKMNHAQKHAHRHGLPPPSTEGMIPKLPSHLPIPEPARGMLRDIGLIDKVAAGDPVESQVPERDIPRGTVTILFTDIAKSTELAEKLGDNRWLRVLQTHNALVREQIDKHGGTEVKAHGDGFMIVFPSARSALLSAIAIQRSIEGYRLANPDSPVEVRIGLHTGEVLEEDGDYFGRNVILAARIAGEAEGGEILASALVKELTESAGDLKFDDGREVELKGLSRPYHVHRVAWD